MADHPCQGSKHTLAGLKMMRAFVLKHRAGPTYVANVFDPTEQDVPNGWHCQECGLDRDGPTDDWPCEVLVMVATLLWHAQRPNQPAAWAWTAPEDQLIWRPGGAEGHTTGLGREPIEPEFTTYDGADPDDVVNGMNTPRHLTGGSRRWLGRGPLERQSRPSWWLRWM